MAVITQFEVSVDGEEYSRYEVERNKIIVTIFPMPNKELNETITVSLVKARRARDKVVWTQDIDFIGDVDNYSLTIDLQALVDSEFISLIKHGDYFIRVSNAAYVADPEDPLAVVAESSDFNIGIITAERLIRDYAFGLDLNAYDIAMVLKQPSSITGVTVTLLNKAHPEDFFPLTLNVVRGRKSLSWRGGPVVAINAAGEYILRAADSSDFIVVRAVNPAFLPNRTTVEELLVDRDHMSKSTIRRFIKQALDYTEGPALNVFVEPTQVISGPDIDLSPFHFVNPRGITDNSDYDAIRNAVTWYPTTPGHWVRVKLPTLMLLTVNNLFGRLADTRIIDIQQQWVEFDSAQGWIELVPFNRQMGFTYEGLTWATALIGQGSLPNFWRYNVIAGLRDCPFDVQEFIGKKAAIDVLTVAGHAFRGGFSSQSISRDGVSESASYTSSAVYGMYSASIEEFKRFIRDELPHLRGKYTGARLTVV